MWRLILILLILAGNPVISLVAQHPSGSNYADKPLRIEIPARSVNETYRIIPCGTNGIIVFFRSQEAADEARTNWYFTCYDTNFQQLWVKSVPLYNDQDYRFHQKGSDTTALLFVHTGKTRNTENAYEILRIVPQNGTLILNTGKLEIGDVVEVFRVHKGRAWLGVNSKGLAGKIVTISLKEGINKNFALGNGSQISVLWLLPDTLSVTVSAIVSRQVSKKSIEYYLVRYDTNGLIRREVLINTQTNDRTLNRVTVTKPDNGIELLLGIYGQGVAASSQKNPSTGESTGLFGVSITNGVQKAINFYNFLELKSADAIVGENDIMALKKKALKKKKSLTEYSLDFSVLLHETIFFNDQSILTAEIYSPQYHTESFTDFDFYGRPYTNSYSVFDGYRFFNAIVAGFDTQGKLLWDNNIEIRNLVSLDLSPKVVTYPNGKELMLCYVSDGKIGSKIIQGNDVIEKLDFTTLDGLYPDDKVLAETKGLLSYWYGNYFLSYGYQEIKNIALENNNKRLVFYFSKLRFEK
jgi:hypothetical protein